MDAYRWAIDRLSRLSRNGSAVMFDIDDTLIRSLSGAPIQPMIALAREAKRMGFTIVIITARPPVPGIMAYTRRQLQKHGIPWDVLHRSIEKTQIKDASGFRYVLSVGDRWNDLTRSMYYIKLPGPVDPGAAVGVGALS